MKKILLFAAVAAMVCCSTSCKKNVESAKVDTTTETEAEAPAPKEKPADFIANLAANDSSVVVLPSGLAYKVISEGQGERPGVENTVSVLYTGLHTDGTAFDGPHDDTVDFPLDRVIPGFTEGISLMNRGAHYMLYIPGDLGYGQRGVPGVIAPNETLIFDVVLVDFK